MKQSKINAAFNFAQCYTSQKQISYRLLWLIFYDVVSTLGLKSQEIGCSSAFTTFSSHTDDHPFPLLSCVQWGRVTLVVIPVLENWRSRVATAALLDPPPPSCVEQLDYSCPPHCLQAAHRAFFYFGGTRQATASTRLPGSATSKLTSEAFMHCDRPLSEENGFYQKTSKFFTCPNFSDIFSVSP